MKNETAICKICNKRICSDEAVYYFPKVPEECGFSEFSASILHIACILASEKKELISDSLAEMKQAIASKLDFTPFISRDKNVIIQGNIDSRTIEIYNYEDFVELSVPIVQLNKLCNLLPFEFINSTMNTIHLLENNKLKIEYNYFSVELESLSFPRLVKLVSSSDVKAYFDASACTVLTY